MATCRQSGCFVSRKKYSSGWGIRCADHGCAGRAARVTGTATEESNALYLNHLQTSRKNCTWYTTTQSCMYCCRTSNFVCNMHRANRLKRLADMTCSTAAVPSETAHHIQQYSSAWGEIRNKQGEEGQHTGTTEGPYHRGLFGCVGYFKSQNYDT